MTTINSYSDPDVLQARFATRLTADLSEASLALPHDITERLRVGREQALARARELRQRSGAAAVQTLGVSRGAAVLGGSAPWWQRVGYVLPLLVLLAGFLLIDKYASREQVLAAADIDSVLLADDLPPQAYSDPGFAEFLKSPPP
jgi:hypothetical protein